jgi:spermidine/putrescine-binding protein
MHAKPRRTFSGALAGAIAAAATVAASPARAARFDGITLRLATFGGRWRDIVDKYVGKAFEAEGGRIEYVLGQPAQNMAKLVAARGQAAPFDVMETMDNFMPVLVEGKFLEPLDLKRIPRSRDLPKGAADANRVMIWSTQEGIVYNVDKLREAGIAPPTRYADLANPKLKGRVSVPDVSAGGAIPAIVGMAVEAGGSENDIDPALEMIKRISPASFWSSSSNLQTQLANGDVWVAAAQAGNVQRLKGQVPLAMVHPTLKGRTGIVKQGYLVKIRGTRHSEAADWVVDRFLGMEMQLATSTEGGQVPSSATALAELRKDASLGFLKLKPSEIENMFLIDYNRVNQAAYVQKWNRSLGSRRD